MKRSPWKLSPLFSPHSIAVIGASPKGGAGSIVIRNLQRLGFAGTIHPVNPKYADVLGYPCHPSLETIPGPVDCAAVLLGDKAILPILKTAHARGVKGVWAFASGFAETGEQGAAMQREIRDFCRETGLLFCGPNCVGYANITDGVGMYSAPLPRAFRKGSIGVIAQSGAVLLAEEGRRTFLQKWQERKRETITHPFLDEKMPWGLVPYVQSLLLARYLRGDLEDYPPFLWK